MGRHTVLFHQALAEQAGLNATDSRVFSYLNEVGPASAGELAALTGLTTGAVTRIVDRLERAGFARREADPHDRRKVIIAPIRDSAPVREMGRLFASLSRAFAGLTERYGEAQLELILDFAIHSADMLREETAKLQKKPREAGGKRRE
jgi:predicted transcriptional regulator